MYMFNFCIEMRVFSKYYKYIYNILKIPLAWFNISFIIIMNISFKSYSFYKDIAITQ